MCLLEGIPTRTWKDRLLTWLGQGTATPPHAEATSRVDGKLGPEERRASGALNVIQQCPHLSDCGLLLAQPHNQDAVSLSDTPLGPRGKGAVGLVQHNPVHVFLLPEPAGQAVLMDAETGRRGQKPTMREKFCPPHYTRLPLVDQ